MKKIAKEAAAIAMAWMLTGCGYTKIEFQDQQVRNAMTSVVAAYSEKAAVVREAAQIAGEVAPVLKPLLDELDEKIRDLQRLEMLIASREADEPIALFVRTLNDAAELFALIGEKIEQDTRFEDRTALNALREKMQALKALDERIAVGAMQHSVAVRTYNEIIKWFPVERTLASASPRHVIFEGDGKAKDSMIEALMRAKPAG